MARCEVYTKDFSVANLGMRTLIAHAQGSKHLDLLPKDNQPYISFSKSKNVSSDEPNILKQTASMDKQIATNADIRWSLEVAIQLKYK